MKVHYLNTDLDLESPKDLAPIVQAFGDDAVNLYNGEGHGHFVATFEIAGLVDGPDSIIQHFCMLAESLDGEAKALWDGCYKKVFDIGYEGGSEVQSYTDELRAGTLKRVSDLTASIRITVYPMHLEEK